MENIKSAIKYCITLLIRTVLNTLNIFVIKKNRILFYSFNGKQYSCNPRKITEYLLEQDPGKYEIIWAFKEPNDFKEILPNSINVVKFRSLKYYYLAKTSHIIIFNVQGFGELSRRKKQVFIQTWHASNGYKRTVKNAGIQRKLKLLYHKDYSYVLSGSENMKNRRIRGNMGFNGPVIRGTPRVDELIKQQSPELIDKVYSALNIDRRNKLLLYAPTWRDGDRKKNDFGIDYCKLLNQLTKRFGGEWIIAVRLHPNIYTDLKVDLPYVINATYYPDIQELLYAADVLISDYSSCIWDFSFLNRPCFLFCQDLNNYNVVRSFDIPIQKWHFPVCENIDELMSAITKFDAKEFSKKMQMHHREMGNWEDGKATERVCSLIDEICSF